MRDGSSEKQRWTEEEEEEEEGDSKGEKVSPGRSDQVSGVKLRRFCCTCTFLPPLSFPQILLM